MSDKFVKLIQTYDIRWVQYLTDRAAMFARRHWGVSGLSPGPTSMLIFIVGSCSHVYCYHLCDWSVKRDLPNSWSIGHFEVRR